MGTVKYFSQDYANQPSASFPLISLPGMDDPNTPIKVDLMESEMRSIHSELTEIQRFNMQRTINNMPHRSDALIDPTPLTPMTDESSKSVLHPEVTRHYTDQFATMI